MSMWKILRLRPLPRSLFLRVFLSVFALSLLLVAVISAWFHHRSFERLDTEASNRLLTGARLLASDLAYWQRNNTGNENESFTKEVNEFLAQRFSTERNMGWIQNVYWVDMRKGRARFLASYSVEATASEATLLPPTLEEVEELIDQGLSALDAGRPAFPDPFTQSSSRRFKIVLWPILDSDGFLDSVVGLEADLDYLDLKLAAQQTTLVALLLAVPLCLLISLFIARGISRRIDILLSDLDRLARREVISPNELGIWELDILRRGLSELAQRLDARERHLQELHAEKLQELSLLGAAIAHEIRNPLSAIELHLGLLKRQFGTISKIDDSWHEIETQLSSLKSLVERFLAYTRRVEPQIKTVDLQKAVAEAMMRALRIPPPFSWQWKGDDPYEQYDRPIKVLADITLLGQVLDNLTANARAARPDGLIIELTIKRANGRVLLIFSDNGPGLPEKVKERLFTPFVTGRPDGHGIGLALSRKLIESQGGRLTWLPPASNSQTGATFCIELPEANEG